MGAHPDEIHALLQHVGRPGLIVGGQRGDGERHLHRLLLPRLQKAGFGEARQHLAGLVQTALGLGHVDLHRLPSGAAAGVAHRHGDPDGLAADAGLRHVQGKVGVGAAEAEGIGRAEAEAVKPAVAHVDALPVIGVIQIAAQMAEFSGKGVVLVPLGPGGGETSGGIYLAGEHVRQGVTGGAAGLAHEQNGVDALLLPEEGGVDDAAHVENDHGVVVVGRQGAEIVHFPVGQVIVAAGQLPVGPLAGGAGDDVNGQGFIGVGNILRRDLRHVRVAVGILQGEVDAGPALLLEHRLELCHILRAVFGAGAVEAVQPGLGGDGEAGVLQTLLHVDDGAGVDVAGAGAALYHVAHAAAKHRQRPAVGGDGQYAAVLQQHHALCRNAAHIVHVSLFPLCHGGIGGGENTGHNRQLLRYS